MCTAISYKNGSHYFGRNLDLYYSYNEAVTVTPRNYPLIFRKMPSVHRHFAMIGMATVVGGYPLYYEATNEAGLSVAGLEFRGNAVYLPYREECDNITPFEFIPWILCQCGTVSEAKEVLSKVNLLDESFSEEFPLSPLHFMISDRYSSVVAEPMADGIKIYDDPVGVLTNNPPFDYHMLNLQNYMGVTSLPPENRFSDRLEMDPFSLGMGSFGLPGDMSSPSRFVRAAFVLHNSVAEECEEESVSRFFHVLSSVAQPKGCTSVNGKYEYTMYSSCCNTDTGVYYYTTCNNSGITAVHMKRCDPFGEKVVTFPLLKRFRVTWQN